MAEMSHRDFASRELLDESLAENVASVLRAGIEQRGSASIVVSGGSTPKGFFAALARKQLGWDKVTVTLADDRWVPPDHADSNERLVRDHLLTGVAGAATFLPLVTEDTHPSVAAKAINNRFAGLATVDVVILGMGGDGHFASLFPGSDALNHGLAMDSGDSFVAVDPPAAPHARMSMTLPRLLDTRHLIVHIVGKEKRALFDRANSHGNPQDLPIAALRAAQLPASEVYWAP